MECDPIETDDPFEASQWIAEEKMHAIRLEMMTLKERLQKCKVLLSMWQTHYDAVVRARATSVDVEQPTQICKNSGCRS
jgi:hypothetical protein